MYITWKVVRLACIILESVTTESCAAGTTGEHFHVLVGVRDMTEQLRFPTLPVFTPPQHHKKKISTTATHVRIKSKARNHPLEMDFITDSLMEVFYYFRLGQNDDGPGKVQYYCSATGRLEVCDIKKLPEQEANSKRYIVVSDTHDRYRGLVLPRGDVFIHAGDILMTARKLSSTRGEEKLRDFNDWMQSLDVKHKIVIAGNHDKPVELLGLEKTREILSNAIYLQNELVEIDSTTYFGCPLSSGHSGNNTFQSEEYVKETEEVLNTQLTKEVDVLITHGPNFEISRRLKPKLHVWGHAHHYYGIYEPGEKLWGYEFEGISVNSSIMTTKYKPNNLPIVLDFKMS